jgi:RNA polymerase sigma-70 factor (ECF subfamily)
MNDDLRIIQQVLDGNVDAFRLLVERYEGPLFSFVGNLAPDRNDRDDIAQETFLAAYLHLGSYDPGKGQFSTWLLTIARNKCFNGLKKHKLLTMETLPPVIDPRSPADALIEGELFARLDRALAELPLDQKSAFVLSEIQGLSQEEICRIEGAPPGTIKSRISRAKEKLRSLFSYAEEHADEA